MTDRMSGKVTIEVSDADTGELRQREVGDNYIHPLYLESLNWAGQYGTFRSRGGDSTFLEGVDAFSTVPFAGLLLTSNHATTSPQTEMLPVGEVIGNGRLGVGSSGSTRGSYNAAESIHTLGYHKLVYDFTTEQALGDIGSVYTGPFNNDGTIEPYTLATLEAEDIDRRILHYDESGDRFVATSYQEQKVDVGVIDTADLLNAIGGEIETETIDIPTGPFVGFCIAGSRWYWSSHREGSVSDGYTVTIYSAPFSDLQAYRQEVVISESFLASHDLEVSGIDNVHMDHNGQRFILAMAGAPIMEFNNAWALVNHYHIDAPSNTLRHIRSWSPGVISTTDRVYRLSNGQAHPGTGFTGLGSYHPLTRMFGLNVRTHSTSGLDVNQLNLTPRPQFFSRRRLPSVITKTEADVMKVVYEFHMPELEV